MCICAHTVCHSAITAATDTVKHTAYIPRSCLLEVRGPHPQLAQAIHSLGKILGAEARHVRPAKHNKMGSVRV